MFRHMFDARDERRIPGNLFDSMHTFINYVALPYEAKSENIAISHLIKIQPFVAKALQSPF